MTSFQQESALAHCAAQVQQLNCCIKKCQSSLRPICDLQTAEISVLWIMSCVYHRQIHSVDELKWQLIDVWCGCGLEQSIFDEAIDKCQGRLRACVDAKGGHFKYSL